MLTKSMYEAIRELITLYDEGNQEFTPAVQMALNALRPYVFRVTSKPYTRIVPFPSAQEELPLEST